MHETNLIQTITVCILPILLAIIVHEVAHGYVANKLGDQTALIMGRLTLNPLRHIDLFGTIILPFLCLLTGSMIFGWAKPVPIDQRKFKNLHRDLALVAIAGPLANLVMAVSWAGFTKIMLVLFSNSVPNMAKLFLVNMGLVGIAINVLLMILNLVPIPPLDGSKLISSLIPRKFYNLYFSLENYGFIILFVLFYTGIINKIIGPYISFTQSLILDLFAINS